MGSHRSSVVFRSECQSPLSSLLSESEYLLAELYKLTGGLEGDQFNDCNRFVSSQSEYIAKLVKKFPEVPDESASDRPSRDVAYHLKGCAQNLTKALGPYYHLYHSVMHLQKSAERVLADHHQLFVPLILSDTPKLLHLYMELFCNIVKLSFLVSITPAKLVMQLYTVAYQCLCQALPSDHPKLCNFIEACDVPATHVQHQCHSLGARIGQILELAIVPVLTPLVPCHNLRTSRIFDVYGLQASEAGVMGMSQDVTYSNIQNLGWLREWALMGMLACPAVLQSRGTRELLRLLLVDSHYLHVYRDIKHLLHPLFDAHVRPFLEQQYHRQKSMLSDEEKQDLKSSQTLIEETYNTCLASCSREHTVRRMYITEKLMDMTSWFPGHLADLARSMPMVLAAMAYAKSEVLWYLDHAGPVEAVKVGSTQSAPAESLVNQDLQVLQLLTAHHRLHTLLLRYSTALQSYIRATVTCIIQKQLMPALEHLGPFSSPQVEVVATTVKIIADTLLAMCEEPTPEGLMSLSEMRNQWIVVASSLFSHASQILPDKLITLTRDPLFLQTVEWLLEWAPFVQDFRAALLPACSLQKMAYHPRVLRSLVQGAVSFRDGHNALYLEHCCSPLHVLHWLSLEDQGARHGEDFTSLGEDLAVKIIGDVTGVARTLLQAVSKEWQALQPSFLSVAPPASTSSEGTGTSTLLDRTKALFTTPGPTGTQTSLAAGSTMGPMGGSGSGGLIQLVQVVGALNAADVVPVSPTFLVVPREFLIEMVQQLLEEELIPTPEGPYKVILSPCCLRARVKVLMKVCSQIQPALKGDLMSSLCQVLVKNCQPEKAIAAAVGPDSKEVQADASSTTLKHYCKWFLDNMIWDQQGWGAMFAPGTRSFICAQPPPGLNLDHHLSLTGMNALMELFGPYAALNLASSLEPVITDCVSQLDTQLAKIKHLLNPIITAFHQNGACLAPCQAAASALASDLTQTISTLRVLSRCLGMRLIISQAVVSTMKGQLPYLPEAVEALTMTTAGGVMYSPQRHISDVFALPRPGSGIDCSPTTADPYLTKLLVGNNSKERYTRWFNLPALLGLVLATPSWNPGAYDPSTRSFTNEAQAIILCIKALALAQEEATNKMLSLGSSFLHPNAASPMQNTLLAFATVASTLLHSQKQSTEAVSMKLLLLNSVHCPQLPPSALDALNIGGTRTWSAMRSALKDHMRSMEVKV